MAVAWLLSLALISDILIGLSLEPTKSCLCSFSLCYFNSPWQACLQSRSQHAALRVWGCMPAGAGDTETSCLHVMLSLYIRGTLCSFFLPNGFRPSLSFGCSMLFPFTPSVMGITWMQPYCQRTQTTVEESLDEDHTEVWSLTFEPSFQRVLMMECSIFPQTRKVMVAFQWMWMLSGPAGVAQQIIMNGCVCSNNNVRSKSRKEKKTVRKIVSKK